jgi:hypothetical protein
MNYSILIVKILAAPEQIFLKEDIPVTKIKVKLVQTRTTSLSNDVFTIFIWGNVSSDIIKYYITDDYVVIEGYISLKENKLNLQNSLTNTEIRISILNIYPFTKIISS